MAQIAVAAVANFAQRRILEDITSYTKVADTGSKNLLANLNLGIFSEDIEKDRKKFVGNVSKNLKKKVNRAFSGIGESPKVRGRRLNNFAVQSSAYSNTIQQVYGTSRVAGNIIWSQPIKEVLVSNNSGGGKGGITGGVTNTSSHYEYFITLAIAICEGEIDSIERVWADTKVIDPSQFSNSYRLYLGSETQLVDPTIESFEGVGNIPAYRGLAYVVIEDFPLADYGNRIPNFTFEVKRKLQPIDIDGNAVEDMITSMIMIPGSGEFVYDTVVQNKVPGQDVSGQWVATDVKTRINQTNTSNKANALVALDQLQESCPNVNYIGLVAGWFGNDLDAGLCVLKPGVEYDTGAQTEPDLWAVAGTNRSTAHLISTDGGGNPVYGGTPSDSSITRYLDEMATRGLKVMFYPMFFMDTANKPWRGRVTGSATDVANFFTKTDGYNDFILHYANLVVGKVDAFVIGSELIGLTSVNDGANNFPAVDALVSLAAAVKTILGSGVKVTYAADWSEYHHEANGWYNLDPLWASPNIDMVGIDAYFPLTDAPQTGYDVQAVKSGWTSGEGYDWYYTDPERTTKANLDAKYAWKNIDWWWKNSHVNPDLATTSWVAESKPIWFTEYGFPSVDGATNQPNVFYDPNSSESFFPRFSKGNVDNRTQRLGLAATESQWFGSTMIEEMFVWTWDARPFPFWPELKTVWADGDLWKTGHWVQGKLGLSGLGAVVEDICLQSGLTLSQIDVTGLSGLIDGYVLNEQYTAKQAIELLQQAYFFDAVESDGVIKFITRGNQTPTAINSDELIVDKNGNGLNITRRDEIGLPQKVDISYINRSTNYQTGNQHSQRLVTSSQEQLMLSLPIVMNNMQAKYIADVSLYNAWMERLVYSFIIAPKYNNLEPSDVITIIDGAVSHNVRIVDTNRKTGKGIEIAAIAEDISIYDSYSNIDEAANLPDIVQTIGDTNLKILDLPVMPAQGDVDGYLRFAGYGVESGWRGAVIYRSDDGGVSYSQIQQLIQASVIGTAIDVLADGTSQQFDLAGSVDVIVSGELSSVTDIGLLNGANIALLGNEIIQFGVATLLSQNKYRLTNLLRGRLGTEHHTASHAIGDDFILLDASLVRNSARDLIGLNRPYKAVTAGKTLDSTSSQNFIYNGLAYRPYSPVHIISSRNGGGDVTANWVRRDRSASSWRDNIDIQLSEVTEQYEIDILNGSNIVRTISTTTTTASYLAVDQVTDFGSAQSNITAKIYQISDVVGRGTTADATL